MNNLQNVDRNTTVKVWYRSATELEISGSVHEEKQLIFEK